MIKNKKKIRWFFHITNWFAESWLLLFAEKKRKIRHRFFRRKSISSKILSAFAECIFVQRDFRNRSQNSSGFCPLIRCRNFPAHGTKIFRLTKSARAFKFILSLGQFYIFFNLNSIIIPKKVTKVYLIVWCIVFCVLFAKGVLTKGVNWLKYDPVAIIFIHKNYWRIKIYHSGKKFPTVQIAINAFDWPVNKFQLQYT
jgi:hypothetical protein